MLAPTPLWSRNGSGWVITSSPGAQSVTVLPTASTRPAASTPSAIGGRRPTSQPPVRTNSSQLPTPVALTRINTSSSASERGPATSIVRTSPPVRQTPVTSIADASLDSRRRPTGRPSRPVRAQRRVPPTSEARSNAYAAECACCSLLVFARHRSIRGNRKMVLTRGLDRHRRHRGSVAPIAATAVEPCFVRDQALLSSSTSAAHASNAAAELRRPQARSHIAQQSGPMTSPVGPVPALALYALKPAGTSFSGGRSVHSS